MAERLMPRYPIYVPSKGRFNQCHTARFLVRDRVPFHLVVEEQEADSYAEAFGRDRLLILPESDQGLIYARNWIKAHSVEGGHARHWQLDDNILRVRRVRNRRRVPADSGVALRVVEDFVDRYENVAVAGLNYQMFACGSGRMPPFVLNCHVYSASLILNALPYGWRSRYNDDTDICLRVLSDGWCTVLVNAFVVEKLRTMTVAGGNTTDLYQGDGRLRMARSLQRLWPRVVTTKRRFKRPQHVIRDSWRKFDTPLRRRTDVDFDALPDIDEYGLQLRKATDGG